MTRDENEAIERVLSELRSTASPAGMEQRIVQAIEERGLKPSRRRWRGFTAMRLERPVRPTGFVPVAGGVALGAVLVVFLTLSLIHRASHPSTRTISTTAPATAVDTTKLPVPARAAPAFPAGRVTRAASQPKARRAAPIQDSDSLALQEMRAASMPAPPLPLTQEERLLLRIAHKGYPEELAMLDAKVRARQEIASKAQFESFFEPSMTKEIKPIEQ